EPEPLRPAVQIRPVAEPAPYEAHERVRQQAIGGDRPRSHHDPDSSAPRFGCRNARALAASVTAAGRSYSLARRTVEERGRLRLPLGEIARIRVVPRDSRSDDA